MSNRRHASNRPRKSPPRRPASKPWTPWLKLPPFLPVPLRTRRDGWTPARQARFIGLLAQFGSVSRAAAILGLSRESAYRLRRHPGAGSFRTAWDTAMQGVAQPVWKFTGAERRALGLVGPFHIRLWQGRPAAIYRKPCDSRLLSDGNALERQLAHLPPWAMDDLIDYLAVREQIRRSASPSTPRPMALHDNPPLVAARPCTRAMAA